MRRCCTLPGSSAFACLMSALLRVLHKSSAKWSLLNGDDELVWGPDPELTALGQSQAELAHNAWARELQENGATLPEKFIVSPFVRAADTGKITWQGLADLSQFELKEYWRETIGEHVRVLDASQQMVKLLKWRIFSLPQRRVTSVKA